MQTYLFENEQIIVQKTATNEREKLLLKYNNKLRTNRSLSRQLVSFQDNKRIPFYRWLKFKEGFSSNLVKYLLTHYKNTSHNHTKPWNILDPFAGAGTTVTTAIEEGNISTGIELLPVGIAAMKARLISASVSLEEFIKYFEKYQDYSKSSNEKSKYQFPHLKITEHAFSEETERSLAHFMAFLEEIPLENIRFLFWFACLSILEEISYTSKDGQYLRWDHRSGRSLKSKYIKNNISSFHDAILRKLELISYDLKRSGQTFNYSKKATIIEGSCLEELPRMMANQYDLVITSPPYCNRYDYTRTYALELAFIGYDEKKIKKLRQSLLSATVENRTKEEYLYKNYLELQRLDFFENVMNSFKSQKALQEVLKLLTEARDRKELNNNNIPNMVSNYFLELNFVIHELSRVLRPGGRVYMVNDNVQYAGEEIPVDLILSDFAEHSGLKVNEIWILPRGKGNSSQQMGTFGRREIRKCIYIWQKI